MSLNSPSYDFHLVPIMWEPKEDSGLRVKEFWKYISKKYSVQINNYWDLHQWTIENIVDFWKEMWEYSEIICSKSYDEVLDETANLSDIPVWFKGAELNYAENVLKYRDDHIALIIDGEEREQKNITYAQMYTEVCRYAAALKKLGLKKNDCVVCFMSNREEAIFAMLAATAAGAIWSGALPLFGVKAVINRFLQVKPKFLFSIDRFVHNGNETEMLEKLKEISNEIPSLEKIVIVPSKPSSLDKDISDIKNSCFLEEFLSNGLNDDGSLPAIHFEQLPVNHPVFISYTSGTTGTPKALVHGVGCLLTISRDFWLHDNGARNHVWLCTSPAGWVSWTVSATMLSKGLTLVVYEGVPFFLSPTSLWDMVDKYHISNLFLTASCLDDLEKKGYVPTENNDLTSLKLIISGASVVKLQNYDFVYKKIKSDVLFGSAYASTELLGTCMLLERTLPVHRGEISALPLGFDVRCFDENGKSVEGEIGELAFLSPSPSFPLFIWNDENGTIFRNTYFSKYPDAFTPGDICLINPLTKGIIICGRSDDTLKQRGTRFGSSDIYNIVNSFPEIRDSLCVSQYNGRGDERAVLFLKMKTGHLFTEDLIWQVRKAIESELSVAHVPEVIVETKDIPYNMNGKKMEIVVKKIINGMKCNTETVTNEECLSSFVDVPELMNYK